MTNSESQNSINILIQDSQKTEKETFSEILTWKMLDLPYKSAYSLAPYSSFLDTKNISLFSQKIVYDPPFLEWLPLTIRGIFDSYYYEILFKLEFGIEKIVRFAGK